MYASRLERGELDSLATRVVKGEVYLALNASALERSFGHLFALLHEPLSDDEAASIGGVYEERSKASPTGVNGYPFFFSCKLLHRDDVEPLHRLISKKERRLFGESLFSRLRRRLQWA